jgi:hypothetical protein
MTEWFRSWHGAPTDPKWRTIARRAGVRPGDVTALVWVLLDRASQATPRGSIAGYDAEVLADALGFEEAQITAIIEALHEKNVLDDDAFASWEKHQPIREDDSAARAKAHRERMKREAEEAERNRTQPNATDRQIREEEIREEKKVIEDAPRRVSPRKSADGIKSKFEGILSPDMAQAVIAHRKAKKAPLTEKAAELLAKRFSETVNPEAAAAMMIERGWQGFDPTWAGDLPRVVTLMHTGPPPTILSQDEVETELRKAGFS